MDLSNSKDLKSLGSGNSGFKSWKDRIEKFKEWGCDPRVIEELEYATNPQPSLLETFPNKYPENIYLVPFVQPKIEFVSNCPKTGQPDFARIEFVYVPNDLMIESKSVKLYLLSYKNAGCFHEDTVNRIANDLMAILKPKYLRVFGDYVSRGSLSIKPLVERWNLSEEDKCQEMIVRLVQDYDKKLDIK
ncbi:MAG: preQ(1) synthase [Candidatus Pacearchaeota archaeon]|jgi:7-cyano-7-deazaguanine reductase